MAESKEQSKEQPKYLDIDIKGQKFRMNVFSPAIGSMVLFQWPLAFSDEATFMSIRRNVLNVVEKFDPAFPAAPLKIFHKGASPEQDKWAIPELDMGTQTRLVIETVTFTSGPTTGESTPDSPDQKPSTQLPSQTA